MEVKFFRQKEAGRLFRGNVNIKFKIQEFSCSLFDTKIAICLFLL